MRSRAYCGPGCKRPVLVRCWAKRDCDGRRRLPLPYRHNPADLHGLWRAPWAYSAFRGGEGTANAVRVYALPGFKSPSLRSSQALSLHAREGPYQRSPATARMPGDSGDMAGSVGTTLKLPCCFEGVLDGAGVAIGEVSDDHHVLGVAGWHAEGFGELA